MGFAYRLQFMPYLPGYFSTVFSGWATALFFPIDDGDSWVFFSSPEKDDELSFWTKFK